MRYLRQLPLVLALLVAPGVLAQIQPGAATASSKSYYLSATITPAASATDVFAITGTATKLVRIQRLSVTGTQTTGGAVTLSVVRRSTANTGGTSSTPTAVKSDTTKAGPYADLKYYTANPTTGTLVGTAYAEAVFLASTTAGGDAFNWLPWRTGGCALRGTSEVVALSLGGVTVTGGSLTIAIEWTEE